VAGAPPEICNVIILRSLWHNPPPLPALCTAKEVADAIGAGPWVQSFLNAKGSERSRSSTAVECFESLSCRETF
jgi:hypothetical protein